MVFIQSGSRIDLPPWYLASRCPRMRWSSAARSIHLGHFGHGDKLPHERELAGALHSRTTVREAVRVLEGEGLVEIRRGSAGVIVAPRLPGRPICAGAFASSRRSSTFGSPSSHRPPASRRGGGRALPISSVAFGRLESFSTGEGEVSDWLRADGEYRC